MKQRNPLAIPPPRPRAPRVRDGLIFIIHPGCIWYAQARESDTSALSWAVKLLLAVLLFGTLPGPATAAVRIADDNGGNIGLYWSRYVSVRDSGQLVVIDGTCASACTMVLGLVPHDRICVTPKAVLGFHAAWRPGFLGFEVINDPATRTLWNLYPVAIRQWIARNGGLGLQMIYLSGPALFAMYRQCR